ncbi:MAG: hypothetical protein H6754_02925 [Candidatus Omnitrophica bacterium]|nr:hypothetical protein [Candidatus Omnitrophota bacterium]
MSVERELIISKLVGFLTGEISKTEIYEWSLFVAVSRDYEELINNNPLNEKIFQFLIEINKPRNSSASIKIILQYFLECLEGKKVFDPAYFNSLLEDKLPKPTLTSPESQNTKSVSEKKPSALQGILPAINKMYILIFLFCSILLNIFGLLKPDFLVSADEIVPTRLIMLREALPHLFYGAAMLIAILVTVPRVVFYLLFFIATWGMFFYWYSATDFILKNGWSLILLIPLLPIITLPPTLMFLTMLNRWFSQAPQTVREIKK